MRRARPKLAVWKFASCDGCQLSLLNCESELLALAERIELAYFLEASSEVAPGPYDISLVEGSITTPGDAERISRVRRESKTLVAIGACATAGGIQALRNIAGAAEFASLVYARPDQLALLDTATPVSEHVEVDHELQGCPIDKRQLLELLAALLAGRRTAAASHSVCVECKRRGNVCVAVAHGTACLGPVTHAGCGALCPTYGRGCFGCFGPMESANPTALDAWLVAQGASSGKLGRLYRSYNATAPAFSEAADRNERQARARKQRRTSGERARERRR